MENRCSRCRKKWTDSNFKTCKTCRKNGEKYRKSNLIKIKRKKKEKSKHSTIRNLKTYKLPDSPEKQSLYNHMIKSNINTAELAKIIGVDQRTILRWLFEEFSNPNQDNKNRINGFFKEVIFK